MRASQDRESGHTIGQGVRGMPQDGRRLSAPRACAAPAAKNPINVGCCDDSPNNHATKNFHATQHPIIEGYDPPEGLRLVLFRRDLCRSADGGGAGRAD
jgi:hypothetical protein